jgi:hypothetical protein
MKIRPVGQFYADGETDRHTWRRQWSLFATLQTCLKFVKVFLNNQVINIKSGTTYYSNTRPTSLNIMFVLEQDIVNIWIIMAAADTLQAYRPTQNYRVIFGQNLYRWQNELILFLKSSSLTFMRSGNTICWSFSIWAFHYSYILHQFESWSIIVCRSLQHPPTHKHTLTHTHGQVLQYGHTEWGGLPPQCLGATYSTHRPWLQTSNHFTGCLSTILLKGKWLRKSELEV